MRIRIDLKIFLLLIIFYFTRQIEIYVTMIIFAIIHELGHMLVGILLKMKPEKIELIPMGLAISFKVNLEEINQKIKKGNKFTLKKIIVALAGPITNLIIILITIILKIENAEMIIYSNILLIIFNLLPICPLDGGRILKGILHIIFGKRKAEKYINNISFVCLIIITLLGSIVIFYIQNVAFFIIIICLWVMYVKEDIIHKRKNKIYNLIEKTIEINANS